MLWGKSKNALKDGLFHPCVTTSSGESKIYSQIQTSHHNQKKTPNESKMNIYEEVKEKCSRIIHK